MNEQAPQLKMDKAKKEHITLKLENSWEQEIPEDSIQVWDEWLDTADYELCILAVNHLLEEGRGWRPKLAEFQGAYGHVHRRRFQSQSAIIPQEMCKTCDGKRFVIVEEGGGEITGYPCSKCLPESHNRWKAGQYIFGYPQNEEELDGPSQSYAPPVEPFSKSSLPIATPAISRIWADWIIAGAKGNMPEFVEQEMETNNE